MVTLITQTTDVCERVLSWECGADAIKVGIYGSPTTGWRGRFLAYEPEGEFFVPTPLAPNVLYGNCMLWHTIEQTLAAEGVTLVTPPPANTIGPPPLALF